MNDFQEDLAYAHAHANDPMWFAVYQQAFPTLVAAHAVNDDGWGQRGGIDRVLVLSSGKTLYVDEKIRRTAYDDILIEYRNDYDGGRKTKGWIAKDLACDFIAYGWEPLGKAYLLPFHQLRRAWKDNRHEWVSAYKKSEAPNKGYKTIGCCVPTPIVLSAISSSMFVDFPVAPQKEPV